MKLLYWLRDKGYLSWILILTMVNVLMALGSVGTSIKELVIYLIGALLAMATAEAIDKSTTGVFSLIQMAYVIAASCVITVCVASSSVLLTLLFCVPLFVVGYILRNLDLKLVTLNLRGADRDEILDHQVGNETYQYRRNGEDVEGRRKGEELWCAVGNRRETKELVSVLWRLL